MEEITSYLVEIARELRLEVEPEGIKKLLHLIKLQWLTELPLHCFLRISKASDFLRGTIPLERRCEDC